MSEEEKTEGSASTKKKAPRRNVARIIRWTIAVILALVLVLVALLPTIISTGAARRMILKSVNQKIEGDLSIDSWAIRWFGGIRLNGIRFASPHSDRLIEVKKISVSSGIVHLIPKTRNIGTVELVEPVISIVVKPAPETPAGQKVSGEYETTPDKTVQNTVPADDSVPAEKAKAPEKPAPLPLDIKGWITIANGQVRVKMHGQENPLLINNINSKMTIESLSKPMTLTLSANQQDKGGTLKADASVKLLENGALDPEQISGELDVDISGLALAPVGQLLSNIPGAPDLSGRLDMKVHASARDMLTAEFNTDVKLTALKLSGGALGKDKPEFDMISLELKLKRDKGKLSADRIVLSSPIASLRVTGSMNPDADGRFPDGSIAGNAQVDLAAIADRFPHSLKIEKDIKLQQGTVNLGIAVDSKTEKMNYACFLKTDRIQARKGRDSISFDEPIDFSARGSITEKGPELEKLKLSSSFAEAEGSGNLDNMGISLSADLHKAFLEADKFMDMDGTMMTGQLDLSARAETVSDLSRKISVSGTVSNLVLAGFTAKPIEEKLISMSANGRMELKQDKTLKGLSTLSFNLNSGLLSSSLALSGLNLHEDGSSPDLEKFDLDLKADLARVLNIISEAEKGDNGLDIQGNLDISTSGTLKSDVLTVPNTKVRIKQLALSANKKTFSEPAVELSANTRLDMSGNSLVLEKLVITSSTLGLSCSGAVNGLDNSKDLSLKGTIECDFARVNKLLNIFTDIKMVLSGKKPEEFRIKSSLAGGSWDRILRSTEAQAGVHLDTFRIFGVNARNIDTRLTVADSRASVNINSEVNGGRLTLSPYVDVSKDRPVLRMADQARLLDDVKITDEMTSELLALIHPIFKGCAVIGGATDIDMRKCSVPLDENLRNDAVLAGKVDLNDLVLAPGGLLKNVTDLMMLDVNSLAVSNQAITFVCSEGKLEPSPLTLNIDRYQLILSGNIGLDGMVEYKAGVPITKDLLQNLPNPDAVYAKLAGRTINVPIEGHISSPKLNSRKFQQELTELLKQVGAELIATEVKNAAKDLLKDAIKDPEINDAVQQGVDALGDGLGSALDSLFKKKKKK